MSLPRDLLTTYRPITSILAALTLSGPERASAAPLDRMRIHPDLPRVAPWSRCKAGARPTSPLVTTYALPPIARPTRELWRLDVRAQRIMHQPCCQVTQRPS